MRSQTPRRFEVWLPPARPVNEWRQPEPPDRQPAGSAVNERVKRRKEAALGHLIGPSSANTRLASTPRAYARRQSVTTLPIRRRLPGANSGVPGTVNQCIPDGGSGPTACTPPRRLKNAW